MTNGVKKSLAPMLSLVSTLLAVALHALAPSPWLPSKVQNVAWFVIPLIAFALSSLLYLQYRHKVDAGHRGWLLVCMLVSGVLVVSVFVMVATAARYIGISVGGSRHQ